MVPVRLLCLLPDNRENLQVKGILKTFPLFTVRDVSLPCKESLKEVLKPEDDLLLLNDDLGGTDVFSVMEELEGRAEVIIVSCDPALGIKAFEHGAAGFLVHPVTPEKMALALWRAYERLCFTPGRKGKRD